MFDFAGVKPKHRMYLNSIKVLVVQQNMFVKPKHRMYLNSLGTNKDLSNSCVKPKHRMYLNCIYKCKHQHYQR